MSAKTILLGLSVALAAAAKAMVEFAEQLSDDVVELIAGEISEAQITPTQIANAELDAEGLPWHEAIHAGTKTKTEKGLWTKKKGVQENIRDAIVAELRKTYPAPTAAPQTTTVTVPGAATISVPTVAAAPQTPYQQLVDWLAKFTGPDKRLSDAWINETFAKNNTSLAALADNQEAAGEFLKAFKGAAAQLGMAEAAA